MIKYDRRDNKMTLSCFIVNTLLKINAQIIKRYITNTAYLPLELVISEKMQKCRILTSLSQCGAYPQIPGRGLTGMTASFSYRGDVRTQSSVVRPWYFSLTSSVILSDCGRAAARSR